MPISVPGLLSGFTQGQDQYQQREIAAQQMAIRKQQAEQQAFEFEQQRAQALRAQQDATVGGKFLMPPPVPQQAPGGPPGQSSAPPPQQQGPQGGPPPMPQQQAQPPQMSMAPQPIPPYRTIKGGPPKAGGPPAGMSMAPPPQQGAAPPPVQQAQTPQGEPPKDPGSAFQAMAQMLQRMKAENIPEEQQLRVLEQPGVKAYFGALDKEHVEILKANLEAKAEADRKTKEAMASSLKERELTQKDRTETERERHDRAVEGRMAAAQSGGPSISKEGGESAGAMVAEGMPLSQVVSGYGKQASAAREKARDAGIKQIMDDEKVSAKEAGKILASRQIEYKGRTSAYRAIETRQAGIEYSTEKIKNDINTMNSVLDKVAAKGGAKILNMSLNKARSMMSDPDYGVLDLVTQQVGTEYERQLSGGQLSVAQLHAGAQADAHKLLNGDMTVAEIRAKLPIMMREMAGGSKAAGTVKEGLMRRGGNVASGPASFSSEADAAAAAKAGKIKSGDKITVNGQTGTWH